MRTLNVKLLGIVIGVAIFGTIAIFVLHSFQMTRNAEMFLRRADEAKQEGELREAVDDLIRFVRTSGETPEVLNDIALLRTELFESGAATSDDDERTTIGKDLNDAVNSLQVAVRLSSSNVELRRKLADLLLMSGMRNLNDPTFGARARSRVEDAIVHYEYLIDSGDKDPEILFQLATAYLSTGRDEETREMYEKALAADPTRVPAYYDFATYYTNKDDEEAAAEVIDRMVNNNPEDAEAYRFRFRYRYQRGIVEGSDDDLERALQLDPDGVETAKLVAQIAVQDGDRDRARRVLENAFENNQEDTSIHAAMASTELADGNFERAVELAKRGLELVDKQDLKQQRDHLFLLDALLQSQIALGEIDEANDTVDRFIAEGFDSDWAKIRRARVLIGQRNWIEAKIMLERVQPLLSRVGYEARQQALSVEQLLAVCYSNLAQPDSLIEAYRRALVLQPGSSAIRVQLARALQSNNRLSEAIIEYERLGEDYPGVKEALFQLRMAQDARQPIQRNPQLLEEQLAQLEQVEDETATNVAMRVELLARLERADEAIELLNQKIEEDPNTPQYYATLANVTANRSGVEQLEAVENALQILDDAEAKLGSNRYLRIARLATVRLAGEERGKEIVQHVVDQIDDIENDLEKAETIRAVGEAYRQVGDTENTKKYWTEYAELRPNDIPVRRQLLRIAIGENDAEATDRILNEFRELLGEGSAEWNYGQASKIVARVRAGELDVDALERAHDHVIRARDERPDWQSLASVEGEIYELQNNPDAAIGSLERAISLGEDSPYYLQRLMGMYMVKNRVDDAKRILDRLTARGIENEFIKRIAIQIGVLRGDLSGSVEQAEILEGSDRYQDMLVLATIKLQSGQVDEGIETLQNASKHEDAGDEVWAMLVDALARNDRMDQAKQEIARFEKESKSKQFSLMLAQMQAAVGENEKAEAEFKNALAAAPDDLLVKQRIAAFYFVNEQPKPANEMVDAIINSDNAAREKYPEAVRWARRRRARTLAAVGGTTNLEKAVELVDQNAENGVLMPQDLALTAEIYALIPTKAAKLSAIERLQRIGEIRAHTKAESYSLARLYLSIADDIRAEDQLRLLVGGDDPQPTHIAAYVDFLVTRGRYEEARPYVNRLESVDPGSLSTRLQRARILALEGNSEEAVQIVEDFIPEPIPPERYAEIRGAAIALQSMSQLTSGRNAENLLDASEQILRRTAEDGSVEGRLILATFLGRYRNIDAGLAIVDEEVQKILDLDPPQGDAEFDTKIAAKVIEYAKFATQIFKYRMDDITAEQFDVPIGWIQEVIEKNPDTKSKQMHLELASLHDLAGQYAQAEAIYRSLKDIPQIATLERAIACNNLAFLLALNGNDPDEAVSLADTAIALVSEDRRFAPMVPQAVDTRGMAHLANGDFNSAIDDFTAAIDGSPSPDKFFHLALAHHAASDVDSAREAMQKAENLGFEPDDVGPLERPRYERLVAALSTN